MEDIIPGQFARSEKREGRVSHLESIGSPADLKKLDTEQLIELAQEIREFICPGCGTLLEVEAVPPGYPVTFDFLPDLEGFYEQILGRPLPAGGTQ